MAKEDDIEKIPFEQNVDQRERLSTLPQENQIRPESEKTLDELATEA